MAGTTDRGLPYATSSDPNNVPYVSQSLAEAVDSELNSLEYAIEQVEDDLDARDAVVTGDVSAVGSGYSTFGVHCYRRASMVSFTGSIARAAANRTISGSFEQIASVPSGFIPFETVYATAYAGDSLLQIAVTTSGAISVRSPGTSQVWSSGATLALSQLGPYLVTGV